MNEWRHVDFIMINEILMIGANLMCKIDYTLRYAKEHPDVWFGGSNIIFAGDFFQFPPVASTLLYSALNHIPKATSAELYKRLGRLA